MLQNLHPQFSRPSAQDKTYKEFDANQVHLASKVD